MAHTKAGGSTSLGRDSISKRLGVKKFSGESVQIGNIIVRQRGKRFHPGKGTHMGKDYTIFAVQQGTVHFSHRKLKRFTGRLHHVNIVSVVSS